MKDQPAPPGILAPEVIESARRCVLCWLATVDATGQPNVSPKEIFAPFDDAHLVIGNIASPTSARNLAVNPRVCVSFVDVFIQKGFKVLGSAHNVRGEEPEFAQWAVPLQALAGPRWPIRSVMVVRAHAVEPIVTPSYRLYPDETSPQSQADAAMARYGVRPAD
jgi:predicted pyridoxine 5'-phosphate oxidase superfamily flavin-nucleotide-binding protein